MPEFFLEDVVEMLNFSPPPADRKKKEEDDDCFADEKEVRSDISLIIAIQLFDQRDNSKTDSP